MSYDSHRNPQNYERPVYSHHEYGDAPQVCKYDANATAEKKCEWCGDWLCSFCGYEVEGERACNECYKEMVQCGHQCTGNCRRVGCNCACGEFHKEVKRV